MSRIEEACRLVMSGTTTEERVLAVAEALAERDLRIAKLHKTMQDMLSEISELIDTKIIHETVDKNVQSPHHENTTQKLKEKL